MLETVRAYGLEKLTEAGEATQVKDAFAAYCLDLAETADPMLRTAEQTRWFRELTAEQDNVHAALRWTISRRDASSALRFGAGARVRPDAARAPARVTRSPARSWRSNRRATRC